MEAASNSKMLNDKSSVELKSLISLAKILAHDVFPTPLGPQKRIADGIFLSIIEFFSVFVTCS